MTMEKQLTAETPNQQSARLNADLRKARQELVEAEAELAREQADVNAFRMHCRLMLDDLVDSILRLRARKQAILTRLQLLRQELDAAGDMADHKDEDPLGQAEMEELDQVKDELLLPTDTPGDKAAEKRLYRELARRFHPDLAESATESAYRTSMMAAVNRAYSAGDVHTLYDLAGELKPDEIVELAGMETAEVRRLCEQIMLCRRRRRKVQRQLQSQRAENTAHLWRKAQLLEQEGENWWAVVRRDLEQAQARMEAEIAQLEEQLAVLAGTTQ
jgi:hypothetical protein